MRSLCTTHLIFSLQRGSFWTELPGTVPRHSRLSGSHLLPPGSLWLFLWIWLEGKPVPGRYGLSHILWALVCQTLHSDPDLKTKPSNPLITTTTTTATPACWIGLCPICALLEMTYPL